MLTTRFRLLYHAPSPLLSERYATFGDMLEVSNTHLAGQYVAYRDYRQPQSNVSSRARDLERGGPWAMVFTY